MVSGRGAEMRKAGRIPEGEHAEACTDSATCFALCLQQSHRTPNKESTDDEAGMSNTDLNTPIKEEETRGACK